MDLEALKPEYVIYAFGCVSGVLGLGLLGTGVYLRAEAIRSARMNKLISQATQINRRIHPETDDASTVPGPRSQASSKV